MSAQEKQSGVAAVVLAAGMSRRMGMPKQLLRIGDETILERTLKNVRASNASEIILVLGHAAGDVQKTTTMQGLTVVINPDYQQGMGTSLRTGLAAVNADAALIVLADQPWVSSKTLTRLIACHQERKPQIIIPTYKGFRGNPVLLDRSVFAEVQALNGDVGCRAIFGDISELNVVGILAQMGGRVITEVSNIMFEQFVNNFKKQLQSPDVAGTEATTAAAKPISAVGVAFSALKAAVTRHSGSEEAKPEPTKAPDDSGAK